jgi:hypothetical protein
MFEVSFQSFEVIFLVEKKFDLNKFEFVLEKVAKILFFEV